MKKYPIAPNGVFDTVQGEGYLLGTPMSFVRLAGCSVGCAECDTDYSVSERLSVAEIIERLQRLPRRSWVWVTGGEPTDHDLRPLTSALQQEGFAVALATAGVRPLDCPVDFLSVSPHTLDGRWSLRYGTQINLVPGLNGLKLSDWPEGEERTFDHHYVTPRSGSKESLDECLAWVREHPWWHLGVQAHKVWGIP
jgi:hypothetical protein